MWLASATPPLHGQEGASSALLAKDHLSIAPTPSASLGQKLLNTAQPGLRSQKGLPMSADLLASLAGILLSLLFSYIPGLNGWFDLLEPIFKRLLMLLLLILVSAAAYGLSCAGIFPTVTCDREGLLGLVSAFVGAMIANQAAYLLSPRTSPTRLPRRMEG